jgi:hypothetical protein
MRNYNPLIRVNEKIDAAPANVWDVITHVEWSPASAARSYMLQAIPVTGFEPATPTSRTPEESRENNDLGGPK